MKLNNKQSIQDCSKFFLTFYFFTIFCLKFELFKKFIQGCPSQIHWETWDGQREMGRHSNNDSDTEQANSDGTTDDRSLDVWWSQTNASIAFLVYMCNSFYVILVVCVCLKIFSGNSENTL